MATERLEKSCGCIIVKKRNTVDEILLIQHARGKHWSFPKGHMERGEDELMTARREVLEETGLHVEIREDFRATSHYLTKKRVPKEVVYYLASTPDDCLTLQTEEVMDARWLPPETALKCLTYQRDVRVLEEAFAFLEEQME